MKHGIGKILRPEQERYLERLLPPRDALLTEMEAEARRDDVPISDPEVGRLLEVLVRTSGARRIVEVGTAIGYGALLMARAAPEARVITIDHDPGMLERARGFLERGGVAGRVELLAGPALEVVPALEPPFDFAYVDFAKAEYRRCLDLLLPKMTVGGTLVFDNLLWQGMVAEPPDDDADDDGDADDGEEAAAEDAATARALEAFNGYLMIHPQLAAVVLPLGDGVGLATKTKPLISEMGGPF